MNEVQRRYANHDPLYENIRCVFLAQPGAMGVDSYAEVVSIGANNVEWSAYNLWNKEDENRFGEVFPPFAQEGYDIAFQGSAPGFRRLSLGHGHTLLVHESIYARLKEIQDTCTSPRGRALKRRFQWDKLVESLLLNEKKA